MGRVQKGDRVGAILAADPSKNTVQFLGFGDYEGETLPSEEATGMFAQLCREAKRPNPTILLDADEEGLRKRVYGCECWWGAAELIQKQLDKYDIVEHVDIDAVRALEREEQSE